MALVCKKIDEEIKEKVSKPIEEWEERQEKRCREAKCNWWTLCLNKLFCWLAVIVVKVVRWVVVTVVRIVTKVVCQTLVLLVGAVIKLLAGLWNVVVGILTLDPGRILKGFAEIGLGLVDAIGAVGGLVGIIGLVLFGPIGLVIGIGIVGVIGFIGDEASDASLRGHVRGLLDSRYRGESRTQIGDALSLDHGAFGLRLRGQSVRCKIDSAATPAGSTTPYLRTAQLSGQIDIYALTGVRSDESAVMRPRYEARITSEYVGGGGFGGAPEPSVGEVDSYLKGSDSLSFEVLSLSSGDLDGYIAAVRSKFRELGVMIDKWDDRIVDVSDRPDYIVQPEEIDSFLATRLGRPRQPLPGPALPDALASVAVPLVASVFRFNTLGRSGIGHTTMTCACVSDGTQPTFGPYETCGATFRDRSLTDVFKWLAAHELGHAFGLCHAKAGLDRVMYQPKQSGMLSWRVLSTYLLGGGSEPTFTLEEAKAVWTSLVRDLPASVLATRAS